MKFTLIRQIGGVALMAFLTAACSPMMMSRSPAESKPMASATTSTKAAGLRTGLNALLSEHVILASAATGHALGGREDAFKAAAAALDANSVDISKAIGSVYGSNVEMAFLPSWRKHIGFFVDYTVGAATKDKAKQSKAVNDLVQYTEDFGALLNSVNPNLPKDVVAELVKTHVLTLKDVVDAQAVKEYGKAYTAVRTAAGHMHMIADPLAEAIVKQFPDKFDGWTNSPAATLRSNLNVALREHVMLAAMATGAALGGRDAEFKAAALDANSVDISKAIGSVYGSNVEMAFLPSWRKHIGFFVDYTVGAATKDKAKQSKAVNDLVQYTEDFGALLNSVNPNLPKDVVAELVKTHVLTLKDVVDAQAVKEYGKAYTAVRTAAGHMHMIADPLAEAIVKQFPDRFASR